MISALFFTLLIIATVTGGADADCDKSKCPPEFRMYKELGCTPIYDADHCCVIRHDCPDYTKLDEKKCHYKNSIYDVRSKLSDDITVPLCLASCNCFEGFEHGSAHFMCAQIECPELFHREPNCVYIQTLDACCSKRKVCDDERNTLAKCYMDNTDYYEGQMMYPESHGCYKCLCTKDFDNSTIVGNKNCKEVDCGFELRYMTNLQKNCAPIYYGKGTCCPISWRCPENEKDDEVIPKGKSNADPRRTCKFGKSILNLGDELKSVDDIVSCSCTSPPYVNCAQN